MARRKAYTKVEKHDRKQGVGKGNGDKVYLGFQCLNHECDHFIFIEKDELGEEFNIVCPKCSFEFEEDGATKFYDFDVIDYSSGEDEIVESGDFLIYHYDYINNAKEFKYCIVCNSLQPVENFDNHASRKSGRQGECKLCKFNYNNIKNQTRIIDQHREAAQKRRLYLDITGIEKIDSSAIYAKYGYKCFNCPTDLSDPDSKKHLDHTLPAYYLWPLTNDNATLLCSRCNGEKTNKWPNAFYKDSKLRELSAITGFDYNLLNGEPQYNPVALEELKKEDVVNTLLSKYAAYMDEIIKVRNRILKDTGFDFFQSSSAIAEAWIKRADKRFTELVRED